MSVKKNSGISQPQKLMIFVLTMSLYGLATLMTELIPKFQVGIVEFSVEYFLFIPLSLAMLFDLLSAALGASTGELVFSEIMLGQFGGLGELEKFLTVAIGVYIAGCLVRNPKNVRMVGFAAILGVILQQFMGTVVDIVKVQTAVAEFEAVPGLPESVFFTEGFAFLNDVLFSGILFCMLPTMYLVPKLYGKIEPLLGMKPRQAGAQAVGTQAVGAQTVGKQSVGEQIFEERTSAEPVIPAKAVVLSLIGFAVAIGAEYLAESGMALIDWEASWAESSGAMAAGMGVAAAAAAIVIFWMKRNAQLRNAA